MRRSNHSLSIALCISLIAHGLGLSALAWWVVMTTPPPKVSAVDQDTLLTKLIAREIAQADKPKIEKEKPPLPKPKPRPKEREHPPDPLKDDSGEATSVGTANRSTTGHKPMQAEHGAMQADLMNSTADLFDETSALPSSAGQVDGSNSTAAKSPKAGTHTPDFITDASVGTVATFSLPTIPTTTDGTRPVPVATTTKETSTTASGAHNPLPNVPIAKAVISKSQTKQIRGHKAQLSDSESIAFSNAHPGIFRDGKLEGRKGLKVKTTIPRLGYASQLDVESLGRLVAVLGVTVDVDGSVLDVEILKSSGSPNIDEDLKLAVLNDWTLESEKDKDGRPLSLYWTIRFE